jgi:hypothetical protein
MPIIVPHEPVVPPVAGSLGAKVGDTFAWVVQRGFSAIGDALGTVIAAGLVALLDHIEPGILGSGRNMVDNALGSPGLPGDVKTFIREIEAGSHASSGISGFIYRLALTILGFGGYMGPYGRLGSYETERQIHTGRFAPGELALGMQRGAIEPARATDHLLDQGYLGTDLDVIRSLAAALPNVSEVATAQYRNEISAGDALVKLQQMGYSEANAALLQRLFPVLPGIQDLITMGVKEAFTPEIAERYGQYQDFPARLGVEAAKQGLSAEWAQAYWAAHWDLPSVTQGFEMLHRGLITQDELVLLLRTLDVMPYWREKMIGMSYNPYTRVDTRRMYDTAIIDRAEVKRSYLDQGYDNVHAENLTEWTCREHRQTQKDLTKAELLNGLIYGLMSESEVTAQLLALGYAAEDVAFEISLKRAQAEGYRRLPERAVQKGDLTAAYIGGLMTRNELHDALRTMGYDEAEVTLLLNLADAQKEKPAREANKNLVKGELLTAYRDRLIDRARLTTSLTAIGYDEGEVGFLISLADFQVEGDRIDDQVSTLHVLYVNGFKTEADVVAELNAFNLPDTTTQNLVYKWGFEKERAAVHPTLAQLIQFNKGKIIRTETLVAELAAQGYQERYIPWYIELIKRQTTEAPPGGWQYIA